MINFDFSKRNAPNVVWHGKVFNVVKSLKHGRYHRGIASLVYTFFDKESSGGAVKIQIKLKEQLAE